ncbi:hypothetical protein SEA_GINGERBUG_37 [Microbacterium phage Gingerbug]|nr:hypothetical protein SEA_GINGERBUG_37 [Microbacterium phage Gingerbug]
MSNAVKTLRREVKRAQGVDAGTVVTFDRTITFLEGIRRDEERVQTFSYAAIFVGGKWHFTGRGGLGQSALTNREFIDRMAESDISNVRVVTESEAI